MGEQEYDHGFSHEEIAYGAFCIYEEEQRTAKYSGQESHWHMAIDRLKAIRANLVSIPRTLNVPRFYTSIPNSTRSYTKALRLMEGADRKKLLDQLLQEPADSPCYPFAQGNAAMILLEAGDPKRAGELAYSAIIYFDEHGCSFAPCFIQFLRTMADAHADQGHYARSHEWFQEICTIAEQLCEDQPDLAEATQTEKAHTLVSWGKSLFNLRYYREAIDRYERAREIYSKYPSGNRAGVPLSLIHI